MPFKNLAEFAKAVRKVSETGIKDPNLGEEIKQDPLTEEEIKKLENLVNKKFPDIK